METIQKYKAVDGTIFNTEAECLKYEDLMKQVELIMKDLAPLPKDDGCDFTNGGGYIQQDKNVVEKARIELTELGNTYFKQTDKWSFHAIGRLFNDAENRVLYSAWGRLDHIDFLYREWGQGYYAYHPNEGVQKPFVEK